MSGPPRGGRGAVGSPESPAFPCHHDSRCQPVFPPGKREDSHSEEGVRISQAVPSHRSRRYLRALGRALWLLLGTFIVGVALEIFLIPNQIIDGGVVGLAIMAAHLTRLPVGLFLLLLNLPFLWLGYKQIGRTFALTTLASVLLMAFFVSMLKPVPVLTDDLLLAAVFGGAILGLGVGIVLRNGGSLDGTEVVAIMASRRLPFSMGEIVMFLNLFILGSAGFVFSWERAMYSLLAYFVAFKAIDVAVEGLEGSKSATIITDHSAEVREAIIQRLGRGVTVLAGKGGFTGAPTEVLYCVISRLELVKLRAVVAELDPDAFVAIAHVHEVLGGRLRKRPNH